MSYPGPGSWSHTYFTIHLPHITHASIHAISIYNCPYGSGNPKVRNKNEHGEAHACGLSLLHSNRYVYNDNTSVLCGEKS